MLSPDPMQEYVLQRLHACFYTKVCRGLCGYLEMSNNSQRCMFVHICSYIVYAYTNAYLKPAPCRRPYWPFESPTVLGNIDMLFLFCLNLTNSILQFYVVFRLCLEPRTTKLTQRDILILISSASMLLFDSIKLSLNKIKLAITETPVFVENENGKLIQFTKINNFERRCIYVF